MNIRRRYLFSGRVQGVGFRYRSYYLANHLRLSGWVRNREDGTVEMEIEGPEESIDNLIQSLQDDKYIRIDNVFCKSIPLQGETSFIYGDER